MPSTVPDNLIVYDGVCKLCNGFVNFVLANDPQQRFFFCAAQSELGAQIMAQAGAGDSGNPLLDYRSVLLVHRWGQSDGSIQFKSDAFLSIARELRWPWRWLSFTRLMPRVIRDKVYDWVARNRYRFFGRYSVCRLSNDNHQARFLSSAA